MKSIALNKMFYVRTVDLNNQYLIIENYNKKHK